MIKNGARDTKRIINKMSDLIKKKDCAKIDYIAIVKQNNLMPIKKISGACLIVLSAWIGKTRLIDNNEVYA